jgi:hypothetical protein
MKKIILLLLVCASLWYSYFSYAYTLTQKDEVIVENLAKKVEKTISKKWEHLRTPVVEAIKKMANKNKWKPRVYTIYSELALRIETNYEDELDSILENIDNQENWETLEQKQNNITTSIEHSLKKVSDKVQSNWYDYCYSWTNVEIEKILNEEYNLKKFYSITKDSKTWVTLHFWTKWYEVKDWVYYFWEKIVWPWICIPEVLRAYSLTLEKTLDHNSSLEILQAKEVDEEGYSKKIVKKFDMNGYKVIVFEEKWWYPTHTISYYIISEKITWVFKTQWLNPLKSYEADIEFVINNLQ